MADIFGLLRKRSEGGQFVFALVLSLSCIFGGMSVARAGTLPWESVDIVGDPHGDPSWTADVVVSSGIETVSTALGAETLTVTGGTLNIESGGYIKLTGGNNAFVIQGGTVNVQGAFAGISDYLNDYGTLTQTGGILNVGGANAALIEIVAVDISGNSIVNISTVNRASVENGGDWLGNSVIYGNTVTISGNATVNLGDNGMLASYFGNTATDPNGPTRGIFINGGTINMDGANAILRAGSRSGVVGGAATPNEDYSSIHMTGGTINVSQDGTILAREYDFSGGAIDVSGGSTLTIAGSAGRGASGTDVSVGIAAAGVEAWGDFNMSGGTIDTTMGGTVDLIAGDMDLNASGGSIAGGLIITDNASTGGIYSKNLNVTGGSFTVDDLTIENVTGTTGSGAAVGANVAGNLIVTGTIDVGNTPTADILSISNTGSLTADASALLAAGDLENAMDNNGTIYLTNATGGTTGSYAALAGIAGIGNVRAQNLAIDTRIQIVGTVASSSATYTDSIDNLPSRTTATIIGNRGSLDQITFDDGVAVGGLDLIDRRYAIANDLELVFNAKTDLVGLGGVLVTANGYEAAPNITANDDLTLGNPTAPTNGTLYGGKLGDVTMASGTVLNINNGSFILGRPGSGFTPPNGLRFAGATMQLNNSTVSVNDTTIDGTANVGTNSVLALGTRADNNAAWLSERLDALQGSTTFLNGVDSVLGIFSDASVSLAGSIGVGTAAAGTPGTADFGAGSLFFVNAKTLNGNEALSGSGGAATIDANSKLYIYNAQAGNVPVLRGFSSITGGVWAGDDTFSTDTPMLEGYFTSTAGNGSVNLEMLSAADAYGATGSTADILDTLYGTRANDTNSSNAAIAFLSRATSYLHNGANRGRHLAAITSATSISAASGAQSQTLMVSRLNAAAVRERFAFSTGLAQDAAPTASTGAASDTAFASILGSTATLAKGRLALWANPVYQHATTKGAFSKLRGNMGGITLGGDFTAGDNFRFGLASHFGGGTAKTKDSIPMTKNSFDYAGVAAFAGWSSFDWSLLLDAGYTYVNNDVSQHSFVALDADPNTHSWNIGLNAEHRLSTGVLDIIPHAGIRYEGVHTQAHSVFGAGLDIEGDTQHLATFPLGVRLGKAFTTGRWTVSPYADLGVLFALGDRDYTANFSFTGLPGVYGQSSRTTDAFAVDGKLGVQFENGRFFGGVDYNLLKSKDTTAHTFSANFGVNF